MKKFFPFILVLVFFSVNAFSQLATNREKLLELSEKYRKDAEEKRQEAIAYALEHNIPMRIENDSLVMELMYIDEAGNPQYYRTFNANAAATSSTDQVYTGGSAGLSLDGTGVSVCEWDAGTIRASHQEFGSRVTNVDGSAVSWHSTHVAGTIMAAGVYAPAKGMAYAASLKSYDWSNDDSEMATEAASGNLLSNHSYGYIRGWDGGTWYGDPSISDQEDYLFGFYDQNTRSWDEIAFNAPEYLIIKSAGNDRNDVGDGTYPDDGPYDCISQHGVAKNILTVGAVNDIPGGYSQPSDVVMSVFSSWGPVDDGRIKPDIVANGIGLTSTYSSNDSAYASASGTSMSSPATTGSLALLVQHYADENGSGSIMRSATLKAIVIHTADEAGTSNGPDYEFGWGLLNTKKAAEKITEDQTTDVITEYYLAGGETYTRQITTTGTNPIKVTVVWTDPAGTPPIASLDPADTMLVNDLDLRVTQAANTYYAWKLDRNNPSSAATNTGENDVDNVEVVDIASPLSGTTYTITVDHDGTLSGGGQAFSMIISGDIDNNVPPEANFFTANLLPAVNTPVHIEDASADLPSSWQWSFNPATITYKNNTSSASQSPQVEFNATGAYSVTLIAANANGSDTITKTNYITVGSGPTNYPEAYSANAYGYISRVQMGTIDKTSTYTNVGGPDPNDKYYEDWTAFSTNVTPGQSYNLTVSSPINDVGLDLGVWIDFNRDGDFYDTNELVLCDLDNGAVGTFSISIPADVDVGTTRMRLRIKYWDTNCVSSGSMPNGEVEDYTLNIQTAPVTWNGVNSNWDDSANWPGGNVPTPAYAVTIPATSPSPVIQSGTSARCYSITLQSGATLTINGDLQVEN